MSDDAPSTRMIACTECNRTTKHEILHSEDVQGYNEEADIHSSAKYQIVRCRGCETVSFAEQSWNSEDIDSDGQPIEWNIFYPSRTERKPIEGHYHLPDKVCRVYEETLKALGNGAPTLAAIGIRAVVEAICADKHCESRNLEKKIDLLVTNGYLAVHQAKFLHLQRFMGNSAAHEIQTPARAELTAALDIAENMLTTLYILPTLAKKMTKSQAQLEADNARRQRPPAPTDKEL
jgi:hypothetical protein